MAGSVIMRPLSHQWRMQSKWIDKRDMREVTASFIKPNDRLTSFERIEIYNRQYWFRLIDSFYDDFPGLRAILGRLPFNRLATRYLAAHPSRSFTMRNLGRHLIEFIDANPRLVAPRLALAQDMVRFEWAQVEAFDGRALTPVTVDDLLGKRKDPAKIRLGLQPYITVLHLRYPLDHYIMRLKKTGLRGDASNAMEETARRKPPRKPPVPRPAETFIVVHRLDNSLYYKRINAQQYRMLTSLQRGDNVGKAIQFAFEDQPDPALIRDWFQTWTELGWFCKPI